MVAVVACAAFGCSSEPLQAPPQALVVGDGSSAGSTSSGAPLPASGDYQLVSYPAAPYGTVEGSIIANLEFLGWRDPPGALYDPAAFEVVRLSDFYNPDGTGDVEFLMINASAVWCSVCRAEYSQMREQDTYRTYRQRGVEIVGALFEDNDYGPAKPEDLSVWGEFEDHAVEFPMVLDPGFKLGRYFSSDVTPLNMIIDARTMEIVHVAMGYDFNADSAYWQVVDQLLARQ